MALSPLAHRTLITADQNSLRFQKKLPTVVWKAFPLSVKTWGEESIVFNKSSGSTHLVNLVAARILSIVQSQPSSAEEIARKIANQMQVDLDDEIYQRVNVTLETLGSLGLLEPLGQ